MIAYRATKGRATVRLIAYRPELMPLPEGHLRVVIQAVEYGRPIAEDPIHVEIVPVLCLARELHLMRCEGWETKWEQ